MGARHRLRGILLRYAFIGHRFHERSKSTQFFQQILCEIGDVEVFTADPDADATENDELIGILIEKTFECFVFLQTEFLAEQLRPLTSSRIIIIPMYDGAIGRADAFWRQFVGARFVSFCREHHEHLVELDCDSTSFQYFPPCKPLQERDPARRTAFFWERRPDLSINLGLVLDLCGQLGVQALHVHAAPDFERSRNNTRSRIMQMGNMSVTWSTWFDQREDYEAAATASLFFFAPRLREGIGMASLEAMSAGQIVVAPDLPSTNEYVGHATTGILYNPQNPQIERSFSETELVNIAIAARQRAEIGRTQWLADVDRLKSLLLDDGRRWSTGDASSRFFNDLRAAASRRAFERSTHRFPTEAPR